MLQRFTVEMYENEAGRSEDADVEEIDEQTFDFTCL
jgi:hypothetical protein